MVDYKTNIIKTIRKAMSQDLELCLKAVDLIRQYQFHEEYESGKVHYKNYVGYTPHDALTLTAISQFRKNHHGYVTGDQVAIVRRLMPKYARQIFDHLVSIGKIEKNKTNSKFVYFMSDIYSGFRVQAA